MALDIWNTVTVEVGGRGFSIRGEGRGELPAGRANLVYRTFLLPFTKTGGVAPEVSLACDNGIPLARGLGSSSAAIVGGLTAGNELCARPLGQMDLLELAAKTEGHPDNVAPALLGGCRIVVADGERLVAAAVPIPPDLSAVLFVPESPMPTDRARSILADTVPREDAVYNMGRVALLVRAFATGDFTDLSVATEDRLHQPARQTIFPAMKAIFRAALDAGALGVFLSGAGSTVLALTRGREMTVGYEMAEAASKSGVAGGFRVTRPTDQGAQVLESE
jgi:homoserine kinase